MRKVHIDPVDGLPRENPTPSDWIGLFILMIFIYGAVAVFASTILHMMGIPIHIPFVG